MVWEKKGRVFDPANEALWWAKSYAHLPTAYCLSDKIRVYYAGLDENKFGRMGYIDVSRDDPSNILHIEPEPVFDLGTLGTFDDCGVVPSCIINRDDKMWLYYIGFQRAERVPYMLFAGLATSSDGITWERYSETAVLDRTPDEPFLRSATTILYEEGIYKMWYVSGTGWMVFEDKQYPEYNLRYATSEDGIQWDSQGVAVELQGAEFGLGRPWIYKTPDGIYELWYSIRSREHSYKMGKAISTDGLNWKRVDDTVKIAASESGWDSEMICYPNIIQVDGQRIMFYNGNQHGRTGFGYAIWKA